MTIGDEDTIDMQEILTSDSGDEEGGNEGSYDHRCYLTNEPAGTW